MILASGSPRRLALLRSVGVECSVLPADIEERVIAGETPRQTVCRLAQEKAQAVAVLHRDAFVLAADTVVAGKSPEHLEGEILGKPRDSEDAKRMLRLLSGRDHEVVTGFCLLNLTQSFAVTEAVSTSVIFRPLTAAEIDDYVATGEPLDKAGAYGIQGRASAFIPEIRGSYTNVVGLPVPEVLAVLERAGIWSSRCLARSFEETCTA